MWWVSRLVSQDRHPWFLLDFAIATAVKGCDGSNLPFSISSSVLLDSLLILVAEKLRCFPGLLQLWYCLDTDKPKVNVTSIQTNDKLKIFKDQMRLLIMPQKLTNGKILTHGALTLPALCNTIVTILQFTTMREKNGKEKYNYTPPTPFHSIPCSLLHSQFSSRPS